MEATEKSQPTHSTPVCGKMSNKDQCQARAIHGGQELSWQGRQSWERWAEVQAKDRRAKDAAAEAPFQSRVRWGLSEPNPIPWSSSQPGEISSAFPIILTQGEERKKPTGDRLYNGNQPGCHIAQPMSTKKSEGQRRELGPPALIPHRGDRQPAPASCPSPPHPVPGTSPVPIPQHKASHTFWLGPDACKNKACISSFLTLRVSPCMKSVAERGETKL